MAQYLLIMLLILMVWNALIIPHPKWTHDARQAGFELLASPGWPGPQLRAGGTAACQGIRGAWFPQSYMKDKGLLSQAQGPHGSTLSQEAVEMGLAISQCC